MEKQKSHALVIIQETIAGVVAAIIGTGDETAAKQPQDHPLSETSLHEIENLTREN